MKHIRHIFENERPQTVMNFCRIREDRQTRHALSDDNISKIYDAAYELIDEVDKFTAKLHDGWQSLYLVEFKYEIKGHVPMNIYENQNEMQEIYKECDVFFKRLNDIGFEVSYYLLETTQHKNFSSMDGKLQIKFTQ